MDYTAGGGRRESERWLEIAGKLLAARDLTGCKRFAEHALEADPLLVGADEVLAVADVLLACKRRPSPSLIHDWYAVLSLSGGISSSIADVKLAYRRLSSLLNPSRNPHADAQVALKLVEDAYAVLSDPVKRSLYDSELQRFAQEPEPRPQTPPHEASAGSAVLPFWTACGCCCYIHQYEGKYAGKKLKCPNCETVFVAEALEKEPSVVPETDMYYCSWGFFPIGFPSAAEVNNGWKPFHPMFPFSQEGVATMDRKVDMRTTNNTSSMASDGASHRSEGAGIENGVGVTGIESGSKPGAARSIMKTTARKKVGYGLKKRWLSAAVCVDGNDAEEIEKDSESIELEATSMGGSGMSGAASAGMNVEATEGESFREININEEVKAPSVNSGEVEDMMGFQIDIEATDEVLGNLQNLPFLREDMMQGRVL